MFSSTCSDFGRLDLDLHPRSKDRRRVLGDQWNITPGLLVLDDGSSERQEEMERGAEECNYYHDKRGAKLSFCDRSYGDSQR